MVRERCLEDVQVSVPEHHYLVECSWPMEWVEKQVVVAARVPNQIVVASGAGLSAANLHRAAKSRLV